MIRGIHHVGIAVRNLEDAYRLYRDALGLPLITEAAVGEQGVRAALLAAGDSEVELLEPLGADSGMAKFLARHGEGLHHVCFDTSDVAGDLAALKAKGAELIDATPRVGLAGRIGFLHPRACAGILVELASPLDSHAPGASAASPLKLRRLVIGAKDPRASAGVFRRLFGFVDAGGDNPAHVVLAVGRTALQIVPSSEAGGVEGMAALAMTASDVDRAHAALAAAATTHGVSLHITRDE